MIYRDKIFEEMQRLDRLKHIVSNTSFSFLVFVIEKMTANGEKKGRVVVDIRKLNDLVISNVYPLSFKLEIITNVQRYINLAMLDNTSFFDKWLLHLDHR